MSQSRPRILVIEDELSQVALLRFNLAKQGFEVEVKCDGEDGLIAAQENALDLILLDWMLPSMPGVEVCRRLRRDKATRKIPIIMLTARSEERDKV
ncbi:MAG: response regulator, partial [Pikeienuella sp.]